MDEREESKLVVLGVDYRRLVTAKRAFGWTLSKGGVKNPTPFRTYRLDFARTKDFPYRDRIDELEELYFEKEETRPYYYKGDILNYAFLYVLFLLPGIFYTYVKMRSRKRIEKVNEEIDKEQGIYLNEALSITSAFNAGERIHLVKKVPASCVNKPISLRQLVPATDKAPKNLSAIADKKSKAILSKLKRDLTSSDSFR